MKAWMVAVLVATLGLVAAALIKETIDHRDYLHDQARRDAATTARVDCIQAWATALGEWIESRSPSYAGLPPFTCASIGPTSPAPEPTATRTVHATVTVHSSATPGPTRTTTVTAHAAAVPPGRTVTRYQPAATTTWTVPGPTHTVTRTRDRTVTIPAPARTITRTVAVPGPHITIRIPGPTVTVPGVATIPPPCLLGVLLCPGG